MADQLPTETTPKVSDSLEAAERRDFLKRAALVGLPVVLATVSSRTVWARSGTGGKKYPPKQGDVSAGGSVAPSGRGKLSNMFDSEENADSRRRRLSDGF